MRKRIRQSTAARPIRGGFTLVELLVSVALVLMIPFMFATLAGFMEQIADRMIGLAGG